MNRTALLCSISLILVSGLLGCTGTVKVSSPERYEGPTPTYAPDWGSHWDKAHRLHLAGELYLALLEYDKALELMPLADSMQAFRAGANINKGEIYLLLFDGWDAYMCSGAAKYFLDQATEYEKQGTAWNIMATQAVIITTASAIYIPNNQGEYSYNEAKQLLEKLSERSKMPEIHYFLGIVNDKLGMREEAKSEFETFLSAPDILDEGPTPTDVPVTFTSGDIMRQRAQEWLEQRVE